MPIRRPPLRFLMLVVGGWAMARGAWLAPWPMPRLGAPEWRLPLANATPWPRTETAIRVNPHASVPRSALPRMAAATPPGGAAAPSPINLADDGSARRIAAATLLAAASGRVHWRHAPGPVPLPDPADPTPSRFRGSAWLFARSGSGSAALAPGGQLGGSQAGLRVTRTLGHGFAAAARVSAPLHDRRGAEAALGVDWQPDRRLALRVSAERRVALGAHARDAWSLYAAGGAWGRVGGVDIDGYAQAGVVGANRGDLFADGALRIGRRVAGPLSLGAGAWGAAQPGVARLDIGPRAAVALPLAGAPASLALEGRLRVAGRAAPGSGAALTLATDF